MNIDKTSKAIMETLEVSEAYEDLESVVSKILWAEFSELLNNAFYMRKYQNMYFQSRDKKILAAAKVQEKKFDNFISDLKKQKTEPKLLM